MIIVRFESYLVFVSEDFFIIAIGDNNLLVVLFDFDSDFLEVLDHHEDSVGLLLSLLCNVVDFYFEESLSLFITLDRFYHEHHHCHKGLMAEIEVKLWYFCLFFRTDVDFLKLLKFLHVFEKDKLVLNTS